ncbi:MAG: hypothetical protein AAF513_04120 [Pseudomonadota bacterium]
MVRKLIAVASAALLVPILAHALSTPAQINQVAGQMCAYASTMESQLNYGLSLSGIQSTVSFGQNVLAQFLALDLPKADAAAGYGDALARLEECHDKIRKIEKEWAKEAAKLEANTRPSFFDPNSRHAAQVARMQQMVAALLKAIGGVKPK